MSSAAALRPLLEGAATVVFNGDTLEERKLAYTERSRALYDDLRRLCDDLDARTVFLSGNHDPFTPEGRSLDLAGGRVFVTHGDAIYHDLTPWSHFRREAFEASRRIRAEFSAESLAALETQLEVANRTAAEMEFPQVRPHNGIGGFLRKWAAEFWPPKRPFLILNTWLNAPRLAHRFRESHRPRARCIVVGHTHLPYCSRRVDKWAINTGAFVTPSVARTVDVRGDDLTVRRVDRRGDRFEPGAEILSVPLRDADATVHGAALRD